MWFPRNKMEKNNHRTGRLKCFMMGNVHCVCSRYSFWTCSISWIGRTVNMLRERNKSYGTFNFVDISSEEYTPKENEGLDYKTVMGRIHAIQSDGTIVTDVEAFRKLYEAVDLGWVYAITKYEPVSLTSIFNIDLTCIFFNWMLFRVILVNS